MPVLDLNCDLGEGEPPGLTAELCTQVNRVNVACGGHAGDPDSMRRLIGLARTHHLHLGAHPGQPGNFGRGPVHLTPRELAGLVDEQVSRLSSLLDTIPGAPRLTHVKLHGSLYHHAEAHADAADAFIQRIAVRFPGVAAVGLPGRNVEAACHAHAVPFLPEGFLDRAYNPDGTLVPRHQPGAVLEDPSSITTRLREWLATRTVRSTAGTQVPLPVQTWCLHADSPGIRHLAQAAARFKADPANQ